MSIKRNGLYAALCGVTMLLLSQVLDGSAMVRRLGSSGDAGTCYVLGDAIFLPAVVQRSQILAGYPIESSLPNAIQTKATETIPETIQIEPTVLAGLLSNAPRTEGLPAPLGVPWLAFLIRPDGKAEFIAHPDGSDGLVSYQTNHEPRGDRHYGISYADMKQVPNAPGTLTASMPASNDRIEFGIVPGGSSLQVVARVEADGSVLIFSAEAN